MSAFRIERNDISERAEQREIARLKEERVIIKSCGEVSHTCVRKVLEGDVSTMPGKTDIDLDKKALIFRNKITVLKRKLTIERDNLEYLKKNLEGGRVLFRQQL